MNRIYLPHWAGAGCRRSTFAPTWPGKNTYLRSSFPVVSELVERPWDASASCFKKTSVCAIPSPHSHHDVGFKVILVVWKLQTFLPLFKREIYVYKPWVLPKQCKNDEYFPTLTGFRAAGPKNLKYVFRHPGPSSLGAIVGSVPAGCQPSPSPLGWKLVPPTVGSGAGTYPLVN